MGDDFEDIFPTILQVLLVWGDMNLDYPTLPKNPENVQWKSNRVVIEASIDGSHGRKRARDVTPPGPSYGLGCEMPTSGSSCLI